MSPDEICRQYSRCRRLRTGQVIRSNLLQEHIYCAIVSISRLWDAGNRRCVDSLLHAHQPVYLLPSYTSHRGLLWEQMHGHHPNVALCRHYRPNCRCGNPVHAGPYGLETSFALERETGCSGHVYAWGIVSHQAPTIHKSHLCYPYCENLLKMRL